MKIVSGFYAGLIDRKEGAGRSVLTKASMVAAALIAIIMLLAPQRAAPGTFVWNFTPSLPIGLYRIEPGDWRPGDAVAVRPSADVLRALQLDGALQPGRLLLKRIAAVRGDIVCRHGSDVTINGKMAARALAVDSGGRTLPVWSGCRHLQDGRVFLLGETANSFDGRYFGPSAGSDIVGPVRLLLSVPST